MLRPCFLVVDREYAVSLSTRKLVIETAKFNVITAYSSAEAVEMLQTYPAVTAIVVDANLAELDCETLLSQLKALQPKTPVVVVGVPQRECAQADFQLESFEPGRLLELLKTLVPEQSREIEKRDKALSVEQHGS